MNSMKRQKDRTLKDELPRSVSAQYATGDQWRKNSRKNEETEAKQKQHPAVNVTGDRSKVWCCKEQSCTGTWNVRSMWSEVTQLCLTFCDPMDYSLPHSSIHGIGASSFSRASSQPRDQTLVSCIVGRHFNVWAAREVLRSTNQPMIFLATG